MGAELDLHEKPDPDRKLFPSEKMVRYRLELKAKKAKKAREALSEEIASLSIHDSGQQAVQRSVELEMKTVSARSQVKQHSSHDVVCCQSLVTVTYTLHS